MQLARVWPNILHLAQMRSLTRWHVDKRNFEERRRFFWLRLYFYFAMFVVIETVIVFAPETIFYKKIKSILNLKYYENFIWIYTHDIYIHLEFCYIIHCIIGYTKITKSRIWIGKKDLVFLPTFPFLCRSSMNIYFYANMAVHTTHVHLHVCFQKS